MFRSGMVAGPDAPTVVIYASGSVGLPKYVLHLTLTISLPERYGD